ncbi:MAG: tRNA preQ1(34) S-adenosylmethionine ribosyltransferase-isomerase QueA [Actinomycetota bacterium]
MAPEPTASADDAGHADYFDYELPPDRIAQHPVEPRDAARLLVAPQGLGARHRRVADLPDLLQPGDLLVVNDTRVLAARLGLRKTTGGAVEVLLLHPTGRHRQWQALVRGSRRLAPGSPLVAVDAPDPAAAEPLVVVGADVGDGVREVELLADDVIDRVGVVPLPPYITAPLADAERYQTVFARQPGSVAAPTAGLHLTDELLDALRANGVEVATVELRVGLGTFRPITADRIADHAMHAETYVIEPATWARIQAAERVVAVGTTVVRTLESAARSGELTASTELFIRRGFDWQVVNTLLTNFHVPRSSLLVLVDAFVGPRWRDLYATALAEGYRFLSFGDAMLVDRDAPAP